METLAEQYRSMSKRNTALKKYNTLLSTWLIVAGMLLLLLMGYLFYIEYQSPLFGRFPQLEKEYETVQAGTTQLQEELDSMQRVNSMLIELSPYYTGVFFEVQIGAFESFDLEKYREGLAKLNIDSNGQIEQYTLGKFRDLETAISFQRDIRRMGIKDAFIVAKIDGKRVTVKEAEVERLKMAN